MKFVQRWLVVVLLAHICSAAKPDTSVTTTGQHCQALSACLIEVDKKERECNRLWEEQLSNVDEKEGEQSKAPAKRMRKRGSGGSPAESLDECLAQKHQEILAFRSLEHRGRQLFRDCLLKNAHAAPMLKRHKAAKCAARISAREGTDQPVTRGKREQGAKQQRRHERRERKRKEKQERQRKNPVRQCVKQAKRLKKSCKPLMKCCTAVKSCNVEYETSPLHDQLQEEKLKMARRKQDCKKLRRRTKEQKRRRHKQERKQQRKERRKATRQQKRRGKHTP